MKLKTFVEEWKYSFNHKNKTIEVFKNPTPKEFQETMRRDQFGEVRWMAKNKNVYIFPAGLTIHEVVLNHMREPIDSATDGTWLTGVVSKNGVGSDSIGYYSSGIKPGETPSQFKKVEQKARKLLLGKEWDWVGKYIPGFEKWWSGAKQAMKKAYDLRKT
ncbi:MAG TPA: hypothetical protein VMV95_01010 [Bacillota bacterium]|nr:hypothetical protein [Bacillota bacterium]